MKKNVLQFWLSYISLSLPEPIFARFLELPERFLRGGGTWTLTQNLGLDSGVTNKNDLDSVFGHISLNNGPI